jgi:tetratricopeptide (TPR) repeat protein
MAGIWVWIGVLCFITHSRTAVWKEPVGFWTDVIDKYPACHIAYNNRGYLYNDFGQYDKAIADFDKGIALSPDYGRLYLNRGLSYYRMKDYDKAFADYSMAIKLDTTEPQSYINRGTMYTDLYGKYDLGIADFHKALRLEPDNEDISANMGVAFYKKGVYDSAIYYYTKSITIYPAAKTYLMRALAYGALKEFDKARQDAGKAKEMGMDIDEATLNSWK